MGGNGRGGAFKESLVDTKIVILEAGLHLVSHCVVLKISLKGKSSERSGAVVGEAGKRLGLGVDWREGGVGWAATSGVPRPAHYAHLPLSPPATWTKEQCPTWLAVQISE